MPPEWANTITVALFLRTTPDYVENQLPAHWVAKTIEYMNAKGEARAAMERDYSDD